ncbi:FAD-binding oxidoreductase [Marinobacterium sediminicola]|uniref:CDP-4-dehydro-6-deoxyglucose reductase n=1 Tax=Marinobacterium sediminicola TaxID=518898 RepID=A0ABY1S1E3_9GAMM|nr:FAD-binding oxidoreductase [Marinobacterium sediminicola]ULG70079.1 FAD-binding oxidoreductase [Marinobacterium sediminicola]SMR74880.1 CDP-4-dehydro-6-deoxyglucose reductase [Marinobacterium sediminicola]
MGHVVTVNPVGKTYEVQADTSILDAGLKAGVVLKHGCRDGQCGDCRTELKSGQVEYPEGLVLSETDIAGTTVLTCQAKALSDVVLHSPEVTSFEGVTVQKVAARVMGKEQLADDVVKLTCKLAPGAVFNYVPGQYVDLTIKNVVTRSYSMATAEAVDGSIELHIRLVPGGQATPMIFEDVQLKNVVTIEGPFGTFYLRDSDAPAIFLASGTGFAPIKALMEQLIATGKGRRVHLYWGGRRAQDLYMDELCRQWQSDLDWFEYTPVLSDDLSDWEGRTGFVHAAVMEDYSDLSGYQVYACGAPVVIDSARRDFVAECDLDQSNFFADAFV